MPRDDGNEASDAVSRDGPRTRSPAGLRAARCGSRSCLLAAVVASIALGVWQVERRGLEARPDRRASSSASTPRRRPLPAPAAWPAITRRRRRIPARQRSPAASCTTARRWCRPSPSAGPGYWVLTPLADAPTARWCWSTAASCRRSGASARHAAAATGRRGRRSPACCASPSRSGGFLRSNDAAGRPLVFARRRRHRRGARAAATSRPSSSMPTPRPIPAALPIGGLTVVAFRNNHLVYALTWFALALMLAGGVVHRRRAVRRTLRSDPAGGARMPSAAGRIDAGTVVEPT